MRVRLERTPSSDASLRLPRRETVASRAQCPSRQRLTYGFGSACSVFRAVRRGGGTSALLGPPFPSLGKLVAGRPCKRRIQPHGAHRSAAPTPRIYPHRLVQQTTLVWSQAPRRTLSGPSPAHEARAGEGQGKGSAWHAASPAFGDGPAPIASPRLPVRAVPPTPVHAPRSRRRWTPTRPPSHQPPVSPVCLWATSP